MKPTHLLVDLENVQPQPIELHPWLVESGRVWVFHGAHQKKHLPALRDLGESLTLVPAERPGSNSLDFQLVFYLGYLASRNDQAQFVVLSCDKDYDPAIEHARALGLDVTRWTSLTEPQGGDKVQGVQHKPSKKKAAAPTKQAAGKKKTPAKKAAAKKAPAAKVKTPAKAAAAKKVVAKPPKPVGLKTVVKRLEAVADHLPTKQPGLLKMIQTWMGPKATLDAVQDMLAQLIKTKKVSVEGAVVHYALPQIKGGPAKKTVATKRKSA